MKARLLIVAAIGFLLVPAAQSAGTEEKASQVTTSIAKAQNTVWRCQDLAGHPRTKRSVPPRSLPKSAKYRRWVLNQWVPRTTACLKAQRERAEIIRTGQVSRLTTQDLYHEAEMEVKRGGIYSIAWGGSSSLLQSLCYEAVSRAFGGNAQWARHIVNRESGCNPGAVNTTYSSWGQQAKCIAQLIPHWHKWVDYPRCQRDLRYSVQVFLRLSHGGTSTGPWG